jgi:hypothetical protein
MYPSLFALHQAYGTLNKAPALCMLNVLLLLEIS